MAKTELTLNIDGQDHQIEVEPHHILLDVLRNKLGFTGTKVCCREGECGVCTVILDGKIVDSCLLPAVAARGKKIVTVSGLAKQGHLDPVQQAFVDCDGLQCGFCTPGFVLATKALLEENSNPTEEEIRNYLVGNICRCTGYNGIVNAVQKAAADLRTIKSKDGEYAHEG